MILSNFNYLPKPSFFNTITFWIKASICKFCEDTNIQFTTILNFSEEFENYWCKLFKYFIEFTCEAPWLRTFLC